MPSESVHSKITHSAPAQSGSSAGRRTNRSSTNTAEKNSACTAGMPTTARIVTATAADCERPKPSNGYRFTKNEYSGRWKQNAYR